jgi:hypothetical protein
VVATAVDGINFLASLPTTKTRRCIVEANDCSTVMINIVHRYYREEHLFLTSPHVLCNYFFDFAKIKSNERKLFFIANK